MANKIALISDDSDFYEYIKEKISLRKSDELYVFSFDDIPGKIQYLKNAVFIVNSENKKEKTLQLLKILKNYPVAVISYNEDEDFKSKCYKEGILDYITLLTSTDEFQARIIPLFSVASLIEKNLQYRKLLVSNNILAKNNEVYINYELVLESELEKIEKNSENAVFFAVSPNENDKFLIQPNVIETVILNHLRKNDIMMNFAPNKYFILMQDITVEKAQKIWTKIQEHLSIKLYAGIVNVTTSKKHLIINEALNKMHEAINYSTGVNNNGIRKRINNGNINQGLNISLNKEMNKDANTNDNSIKTEHGFPNTDSPYKNFKLYRQNFERKLEQAVAPAFYRIRQKYSERLMGTQIHQDFANGTFVIKGEHTNCSFKITSPGFSKINIDITSQKDGCNTETKRIVLEPDELETGVLEDLLEQLVLEYREMD